MDTNEPSQSIVEHVITTPPYDQSNVTFISDTYVTVPEFVIPHSGLLTHWLFAAQLTPTLAHETPKLQVWRRTPNKLLDTFRLVHSTGLLQEPRMGGSLGTYKYVLEDPAQVEAGDVFGFFQPANDTSQLRLALLRNSAVSLYEVMLLHTEPFLQGVNRSHPIEMATPLMSAEIILLGELKLDYPPKIHMRAEEVCNSPETTQHFPQYIPRPRMWGISRQLSEWVAVIYRDC